MKNKIAANAKGITLLEVLISMGILAVGLVSVLALIPAGGTFLRKASVDDRAAALIPNAFATMKAAGLFNEDALHWYSNDATHVEQEESLLGYIGDPYDIGDPDDTHYDPPAGAEIETWHPRDDEPKVEGTAAPDADVTVTATGPDGIEKTFLTSADSDGNWLLPIPPGGLALDEDTMTIKGVGDTPEQAAMPDIYYDAWAFQANPGSVSRVIPPTVPVRETFADFPNAYRHYRRRREFGYFHGDALLDFRLSHYSPAEHNANDLPDDAERIETANDSESIYRRITGAVWRYQTGYRDGTYRDYWYYQNQITDTALQPGNPLPVNRYKSYDGSHWVEANRTPKTHNAPDGIAEDAVDCFCFSITAGQEFEIDWGNTDLKYRRFSLTNDDPNDAFAVRMGGADEDLPREIVGTKAQYVAPSDGIVIITVKLQPAELDYDADRSGEEVDLNYNLASDYDNDGIDDKQFRLNVLIPYDFELRIFNSDRVIAIDPLMASRFTYLIETKGRQAFTPLRRHFARLGQHLPGHDDDPSKKNAHVHAIPRVTWKEVANKGPEAGVAIAERLCRPDDALEVNQPINEISAPIPLFEYAASDRLTQMTPLRRRAKRRMSWLVTVQPENQGSVQANWQAGRYFEISIVILDDRLMPRFEPGDGNRPDVFEGEYVVDGSWNPSTGLIRLAANTEVVPRDDLRRIFAAGSWIMLAPKVYSIDQRIDWVQVQTAEIKVIGSEATIDILPAVEPLNVSQEDPSDLLAVVCQGVVAVSRRTIQVE